MPINSRFLALKALSAMRRQGSGSFAKCLEELRSQAASDMRESALAQHIFTGTYQNMAYLDFCLSGLCKGNYSKLHPLLCDILRLSAYQIIFLERVPAHAAVNEGVKLARNRLNPGAAAMANAVLRRLAQMSPDFPQPGNMGSAEYLSIKYSHPKWFTAYLLGRIGCEHTETFLRMDNEAPEITVQVNSLKLSCADFECLAADCGCEFTAHKAIDGCYHFKSINQGLEQMLADGLCYVQDISARMAVEAAELKAGDTMLDTCAAPGGKSFTAAVHMGGVGRIIASDLSKRRMEAVEAGRERLGMSLIECRCADAAMPEAFADIAADAVLVDAPCSGFGTIRKKPEIREKDWQELRELPELQFKILSNGAKSVKRGGTLLYSTCTVFREENEAVVERFLNENDQFEPVDFTLPGNIGASQRGMLTIWPHVSGGDGFFVAKMRRKDE